MDTVFKNVLLQGKHLSTNLVANRELQTYVAQNRIHHNKAGYQTALAKELKREQCFTFLTRDHQGGVAQPAQGLFQRQQEAHPQASDLQVQEMPSPLLSLMQCKGFQAVLVLSLAGKSST
eukprot:6491976-Amphidinium_carterae.2